MAFRIVLLAFLAALTPVRAQIQPSSPVPSPAKQDPDRPKKAPAERLDELQRELQRLEQEIAFVKERAAKTSTLLTEKLGSRKLNVLAIDAGTGAVAAPMSVSAPKRARLMTEVEVKAVPPEVFMTVNGQQVTYREIQDMVDYLMTVPSSGDRAGADQRATFEAVRIHALLAAFPDSAVEAEKQIRAAADELSAGKDWTDVCHRYGASPNLADDGKVQIARVCPYGIGVEKAAFATKEGQRSAPVRGLTGWTIVQVDKVTKGNADQPDMIDARMILVPYHPDPAELDKQRGLIAMGQVDVIARDEAALQRLPGMLRPPSTAPKDFKQAEKEGPAKVEGEPKKNETPASTGKKD